MVCAPNRTTLHDRTAGEETSELHIKLLNLLRLLSCCCDPLGHGRPPHGHVCAGVRARPADPVPPSPSPGACEERAAASFGQRKLPKWRRGTTLLTQPASAMKQWLLSASGVLVG